MLDALFEVQQRERERQGWRRALTVGALGVGALLLAPIGAMPKFIALALALVGSLGLLAFLIFLSTKSFGRSDFSGSFWAWWSWW